MFCHPMIRMQQALALPLSATHPKTKRIITEQNKMRRLGAQCMPFFRLTARNPFFCDKKCRIIMCCDKTELYLTVLQQNNVLSGSLSGSLWLPMAPSGSHWLSELAYKALAWFTKPLLGSQSPCLAHKALAQLGASLLHPSTLFWSG